MKKRRIYDLISFSENCHRNMFTSLFGAVFTILLIIHFEIISRSFAFRMDIVMMQVAERIPYDKRQYWLVKSNLWLFNCQDNTVFYNST